MTVIATNLVDNKTKVISTVTGSVNEDSQSALDVTKLIDSTSEPRVSVVNVHHEILGTGKVTLLFDKREILELKDEKPINLILPETIILEVKEAETAIKGQTATSGLKTAILENDVKIMVPLHIEKGVKVIVKTSDNSYVEKVK